MDQEKIFVHPRRKLIAKKIPHNKLRGYWGMTKSNAKYNSSTDSTSYNKSIKNETNQLNLYTRTYRVYFFEL